MKRAVLIFLSLTVFLLGCYLSFRTHMIQKADAYAQSLTKKFSKPTDYALYLTKNIYENFGKNGYEKHPVLARLKPFLENDTIPEFLRFPRGVIELYTMEGWCDDAVRALVYLLNYHELESKQWNMQGPHSAHSAVAVYFEPFPMLYDPFFGYYTDVKPAYNDIKDIRDQMHKGKKLADTPLKPIDENSKGDFYKDFGDMVMGPQGEPLTLAFNLPDTDEKLELGKKDGETLDALLATEIQNMGITWDYVGHKYDRAWTRELIAQRDLQLQIILTEPTNDRILRTLKPAPQVDGTILSWNLLKGEKLISQDGLAGISLRRLNSYIGIDQIIITPQGETP